MQDSQVAAQWDAYLRGYCKSAIDDAQLAWPEQRSLRVAFREVELQNPDLADYLLQAPGHALRIGTAMLHNIEGPVEPRPRLQLRITGLPPRQRISPRQLRSEHLNRLVPVVGIVAAASPIDQWICEAVYDCRTCDNRVRVVQDDELLQEPVFCDSCEKNGPWDLRREDCRTLNLQYLRVQEAPEHTSGGETPAVLTVRLVDDLVGVAPMGARIVANGIVGVKLRRLNGKKSSEAEVVLEAVHVELDQSEVVNLDATPEERQRFEALASQPDVHLRLARCLAPSLQGLVDERLGLLYALAGGDMWTRPDGKRERGRIHLLLAGDPGVAKSKLLNMVRHYVPRLVTANAIAASAAGLRAAAVKDPRDGRWMIEPGKLVLGHGHYVFIDELPLLGEEDLPALNDCMEEGVVSMDKVVKALYPADTTVLAAMNPALGGRFDRFTPFIEQLALSPALLSRFDLKFCILDVPDKDRDSALARAQLSMDSPANGDVRAFYGIDLSGDELRRYLHAARGTHPKMTPGAAQLLERFYVGLRQADKENPSAGARQLDALRRLATASAKLRLATSIDQADAQRALDLFASSLRSCRIMDRDGRVDGNLLEGGPSRAHSDRLRIVLQIVKDLQRSHPNGYHRGLAREGDILAKATEAHELRADDALACLLELRRTSIIFQRGGPGEYALMST